MFILSQAKSLVESIHRIGLSFDASYFKYLFEERFKYLSSHAMHIENQVFNLYP